MRLRLALPSLALWLAVPAGAGAGPHKRWPAWPTEVTRAAAPLHAARDNRAGERDRKSALEELERYATEVIVEEVLLAIEDPSNDVRRDALRLCYERRIRACLPAAASIWGRGLEPDARIAALRVLALDPQAGHLAILLGALRDPGEQLRASAAQFLGRAPLEGAARTQVRTALLAKLSDPESLVRRRAVESLGLLGPAQGALAIARLLEDAEPMVRAAAAESLGLYRDPRAAPALLRALAAPNETAVTLEIIEALALLPGAEVTGALLQVFDAPPSGLDSAQIADAIGLRPSPDPELAWGLVERASEPALREESLRALLLLGNSTASVLRQARQRGVEASLDLEFQRLLLAFEPGDSAARIPTPAPEVEASDLRIGPLQRRFDAAARLAEQSPGAALEAALASVAAAVSIEPERPWLLVLARVTLQGDTLRVLGRRNPFPWTRILGWANDPALSDADRCLAVVALGPLSHGHWRDRRVAERLLDALLADPRAPVRACVAAVSPRFMHGGSARIDALLADLDPRVRTTAALASAGLRAAPAALRARTAVLAANDASPSVRQAAAAAVGSRRSAPELYVFSVPSPDFPWSQRTQDVVLYGDDGARQRVPTVPLGPLRIAFVPGLPADRWTTTSPDPASLQ